MATARALRATACEPWSPRPALAPRVQREVKALTVTSNGSEGCYGGWELRYQAPRSPWVRVRTSVRLQDLPWGLDHVHAAVVWEGSFASPYAWEPLLPGQADGDRVAFECHCEKPEGATGLSVRLLLAWAPRGALSWSEPVVQEASPPPPRPWRLAAAGGPLPPGKRSLKTNTEAYLSLARAAAEKGADLLCLPEVLLSTGLGSGPEAILQQAIPVPGKHLEPFQELAREAGLALCFSVWERNGDLVHNCAVLLGKDGELVGKYRKVHLASPLEVWWGVTPGHEFPVYDLAGAKVAMNICMDSSALESARVPARQGAEILCLPIMGDHRAQRYWDGRDSDVDLDRWAAIQRTRAMDNQLYLVISRNNGVGTGIFGPSGDILALAGDKRLVVADVDLSVLPKTFVWATARAVAWWERREPTYLPLVQTQR